VPEGIVHWARSSPLKPMNAKPAPHPNVEYWESLRQYPSTCERVQGSEYVDEVANKSASLSGGVGDPVVGELDVGQEVGCTVGDLDGACDGERDGECEGE